MVKENTTHKTQIIIAIIGLIGALSGALFANWDKIFVSKPDQPVIQESKSSPSANAENSRYIISVYYYSDRENDSRRVRKILEGNGYIVNTYSGSELNKGRVVANSYIYFKNNDYKEMVILRDILSRALDEEFTVNVSGPDKADKTMRIVLVSERK
jgi:hypothetical protein